MKAYILFYALATLARPGDIYTKYCFTILKLADTGAGIYKYSLLLGADKSGVGSMLLIH